MCIELFRISEQITNPTFEAGNTTGWTAAGSASIQASTVEKHTGSYSMKVTGRTAETDGAKQSLISKLTKGKTYLIVAWVRIASGSPDSIIEANIGKQVDSVLNTADFSVKKIASTSSWVKLEGAYTFDYTGTLNDVYLNIQSSNTTVEYYVDDVSIMEQLKGIHNPVSASYLSDLGAQASRRIYSSTEMIRDVRAYNEASNWTATLFSSDYNCVQNAEYGRRNLYNGSSSWSDYSVSAQINAASTSETNGEAGLYARYNEISDEYIYGKLDYYNNKLMISRKFSNITQDIAKMDYSLSLNQEYKVTLEVDGTSIALYINDVLQLTAADPYISSGKIAFSTFRTKAKFDDVVVVDLNTQQQLLSDDFQDGNINGWTAVAPIPSKMQEIFACHNAGISVIVTAAWTYWDAPGVGCIPTGDFKTEVLQGLNDFLVLMGPYISVFTVDNEAVYDSSVEHRTVDAYGSAPVLNWYAEVAQQAKTTISRNSSRLSHLKVASEGMNLVHNAYHGTNTQFNQDFMDAEFNWINSDSNIDFVDVHAHSADVTESGEIVDYMKSHTDKPLIITEWSEAGALPSWIGQTINGTFASTYGVSTSIKNKDYVENCYITPVSKSQWDAFVNTSPLTPAFMQNSLNTLAKKGVLITCYGAMAQYANAMFDVKQLYSTKTVVLDANGQFQENNNLAEQYRDLVITVPAYTPDSQFTMFSDNFEDGD